MTAGELTEMDVSKLISVTQALVVDPISSPSYSPEYASSLRIIGRSLAPPVFRDVLSFTRSSMFFGHWSNLQTAGPLVANSVSPSIGLVLP